MLVGMSSVKEVGIVVYFGIAEIPLLFLEIGNEALLRIITTAGSTSPMFAWSNLKLMDCTITQERCLQCLDLFLLVRPFQPLL